MREDLMRGSSILLKIPNTSSHKSTVGGSGKVSMVILSTSLAYIALFQRVPVLWSGTPPRRYTELPPSP